MQSTRKPR